MIMNRAMVCALTDLRNDIQMFKFQENLEPSEIKQIKSIVPSITVLSRFFGIRDLLYLNSDSGL